MTTCGACGHGIESHVAYVEQDDGELEPSTEYGCLECECTGFIEPCSKCGGLVPCEECER